MRRTVLVAAAVLAAARLAVGQDKSPEQVTKYFGKKDATELPDLAEKATKEPVFGVPADDKADSPAVRAAKRAMLEGVKRYELIQRRIAAGSGTGSPYQQLIDCVFAMYATAATVWDEPEKLLPYAEEVVISLMRAEVFTAPRVAQGIEEPQLGPQLTAARCKAEVVVLKLREAIAARAQPVASGDVLPVCTVWAVPPPVISEPAPPPPATCPVRIVRRPLLGLLAGRR